MLSAEILFRCFLPPANTCGNDAGNLFAFFLLFFFYLLCFSLLLSLICSLVEFSQKPCKNLLTQSSRKFQLFLTRRGSSKLRNTGRWERAGMCQAAATEVFFQLHNLTSHRALCTSPGIQLPCHKNLVLCSLSLSFPLHPSSAGNKAEERPNLGFSAAQFKVLGVFSTLSMLWGIWGVE